MKEIFLANPRGFCSGVSRAVSLVQDLIDKEIKNIYVWHEIVHNQTVVDGFTKQGVKFIHDIKDIPDGCTLVFSAHGVSSKFRKEVSSLNITIVDATCHLVQNVHKTVLNLIETGYYLLYLGSKKHQEVVGVFEESPDNITIIESILDINSVPLDKKKYALISQTTLNIKEIEEVSKALKILIADINIDYANACKSTELRQIAVNELSKGVDVFYVVGSENSSNAKRLYEIAKNNCQAFLIENASYLNPKDLEKTKKIGISAGASTPEFLVEELIKNITSIYECRLL